MTAGAIPFAAAACNGGTAAGVDGSGTKPA
jgi:hypothetical protein